MLVKSKQERLSVSSYTAIRIYHAYRAKSKQNTLLIIADVVTCYIPAMT